MKVLSENDREIISSIGCVLNDVSRPMKERFRALFTLRNIGGETSVRCIEKCFSDSSSLLKHECAYCLGQMQDTLAVPVLEKLLQDTTEEPIVRHEAGEALGAIGLVSSLNLLRKFCNDPVIEVAETCQLAVKRIEWLQSQEEELSVNPYNSIDPAPPYSGNEDIQQLQNILLDDSQPLYGRYRAMFTLRNNGTVEAVKTLAKGLKCKGALFQHEIAYILGQMQNSACIKELTDVLCNLGENEMVRHECAEALGSIAAPECTLTLQNFLNDEKRVVRESCEVALDMCDYENSKEFQYADTLFKLLKQ